LTKSQRFVPMTGYVQSYFTNRFSSLNTITSFKADSLTIMAGHEVVEQVRATAVAVDGPHRAAKNNQGAMTPRLIRRRRRGQDLFISYLAIVSIFTTDLLKRNDQNSAMRAHVRY
jgi:hypothetical protein